MLDALNARTDLAWPLVPVRSFYTDSNVLQVLMQGHGLLDSCLVVGAMLGSATA